MYSTCIFCNVSLGANEEVEGFPVGRRIAFDGERGRLWAVCSRCARWNLSPLEERWEAIEECERRFRDTRMRVSTENVGLARLPGGTELVRIGRALRPEIAAWRYGDQFGARARRRRNHILAGTAVAAGIAGTVAFPLILVATVPLAVMGLAKALERGPPAWSGPAARAALRDNAGQPLLGPEVSIRSARLRPVEERVEGWRLQLGLGRLGEGIWLDEHEVWLHGHPAVHAVSVLLAEANAAGATRHEVRGAVSRIERAGDPARYFTAAEGEARRMGWGYREVWNMPLEIRLALEMASHEDAERRALEGELATLEEQWRRAEEIAEIADRLMVAPAVESRLTRLKGR